jgi:protein arginine kinase
MNKNAIVSYRARLARNLHGYPFPNRMDGLRRREMISSVEQILQAAAGVDFTLLRLESGSDTAASLREQRLISPEFAAEGTPHAVALSADKRVAVMLCEEDHLRIQCFGDDLAECLEAALRVESLIDEAHPLAFDETLGYLTACPTNLGTGLRASALMHLPALTETQSMRRLLHQAGASGLAVRGFYGEGTQAAWGYYQISNAVTLGLTEDEIIEALREVSAAFAELERQELQKLFKSDPAGLSDRIWRSLGTLQNARRISTQEAMECLSSVRMGVCLDLLPNVSLQVVDRLSQDVWPGMLTEARGPFISRESRDEARAELLRSTLVTGAAVCRPQEEVYGNEQ